MSSEYSAFAEGCGGRGYEESAVLCTADIIIDETGYAQAAAPAFIAEMDACENGDPTACDFVAVMSPFGSDAEKLGSTCGGRIVSGALPDCRTRMN